MKSRLVNDIAKVRGRITLWSIDEVTGKRTKLISKDNLILYTWAYIVAKTAGHGDSSYRISSMYMEYYNVASPGDAVSVPSYTRDTDLSYYTGLGSPADFLRVPLSGLPSITVESGYESYFSGDQGNVLTFFAQTSGTTGHLGRSFSNGSNSKLYGAALVATPTWSDQTSDVLFARTYLEVSDQIVKPAGSHLGITWEIPLE